MPSFSLNVETTLELLTIFISIGPYAQITKGVWVHCGESLQLRFWCKIGTLLLKSSIGWKKLLTQRLFLFFFFMRHLFLLCTWVFVMFQFKLSLALVTSLQSFSSPMNQVQSRIWLMHWSLFIFFNHDNGRTQIIDLFNQDKYAFWNLLFRFYLLKTVSEKSQALSTSVWFC